MDNEIKSLGEILDNNLQDKQFKHILKVSTFFSFWSNIVGRKFEKKSKPYSIKSGKLYVTCENTVVVQELSMFKTEVLKKLSPYARGLEIEIEDIVFNYKNWFELNKNNEDEREDIREYSDNEISNIQIDENKLQLIKENIDKIPYLDDSQKEKYFENIKNSLRANALRKSND